MAGVVAAWSVGSDLTDAVEQAVGNAHKHAWPWSLLATAVTHNNGSPFLSLRLLEAIGLIWVIVPDFHPAPEL